MSNAPAIAERLGREAIAVRARAELARRSLAAFFRQACDAGSIGGVGRLQWGKHLQLICDAVQAQLEAWIVAYGPGEDAPREEVEAWRRRHAAMIERQRAAWERTGATWEDGRPEPWLRYVLVQNMIYNLPPGTLKSTIIMVAANAWIWLWAPTFSFGAASGVEANVDRDSRATRDLVTSAWYRSTFEISWEKIDLDENGEPVRADLEIREDNNAVRDWATTAGGRRLSRTISTGFTGTHVDGTFLDDPDDADRVWSEPERLRPQNRFSRAIENRTNDEHRSLRVVLQQRVHPEDFTAYLLSIARWSPATPKGWAWLCVPAEFGMQPEDAPRLTPYGHGDWRTEVGQTLHPMLSAGVLADKRRKMPGYEGQYNGNPSRQTVGMFMRYHARFFVWAGTNVDVLRRRPEGCPVDRTEHPPVIVRRDELRDWTLSVDAANSLDPKPGAKVSAVGLIVGACRGEERYIAEDATRVLGVDGTYLAIYELLRRWRIDRVLVELKALGAGVVAELERAIRRGWYLDPTTDQRVELVGPDGNRIRCEVETVSPGKGEDKVQRAHGVLPTWQQGLLFLLDGAPWLYPVVDANRATVDEGLIEEVCSFPGSRRKDRVDALSQFVARYRGATDAQDGLRAMRRLAALGARR